MNSATPENILRVNHLKVTKPRVKILQVLQANAQPLAVDDIKKEVTHVMDLSTIYRTLEKLVEVGIIYQTDFREGKAFYEWQNSHHHHLICRKCGLKEPTSYCVPVTEIALQSKHFNTLPTHVLEFFGICKKCIA